MTIKSTLTAIAVVFSVVLFAAPSANAQEKSADKTEQKPPVTVVVQPGDTLTSIAEAHNTTYARLYDANSFIANPDQIDVGNEIRIPTADETLTDRFTSYEAAVA